MPIKLGSALLTRLVAAKAGISMVDAGRLMACYGEVLAECLSKGAQVRFLNGYLGVIETKPTRRVNPNRPGEFVAIPARSKVVFRESKSRKG